MTDDNIRRLGHVEPAFPLLDATRTIGNAEHRRAVIDCLGYCEPYIEETDGWVSLPLRLVHDRAAGWHLE